MKRSCKGSLCLAHLERLIDELDTHPDTSRSARFQRAIHAACGLTDPEWAELSKRLKKFKNEIKEVIIPAPTALQVNINKDFETELLEVEETIIRALGLKKLQTRYELEILFLHLLETLRITVLEVGSASDQTKDLTAPQMFELLAEIVLMNRREDLPAIEKIKEILLEWRKYNE